jgi:UDP-N-acetylmuramoylalanine--D-glutamate ligase
LEAASHDWDWLVVELSSFQLEAIEQFRARYGLLLNVSEDHLDRYPDMAAYQAAKARLFENMTADDVAVVNAEDPLAMQMTETIDARRVLFSGSQLLEQGMGFDDGCLVWRWDGREARFVTSELKIRGQHNIENVMAALIPPLMEGCPAELAWSAACEFTGLSHRMELVSEVNDVCWYNDSKGTNVGSVVKSLDGLIAPVTLIAGGKDKQGDLSPLLKPVRSKVHHLILIGEATERMSAFFEGQTTLHRAGSMSEAVELAATITPSGGTVLLSPGCASFDMFSSYEERGQIFTKAVHELPPKSGQGHGS